MDQYAKEKEYLPEDPEGIPFLSRLASEDHGGEIIVRGLGAADELGGAVLL